MFNRLRMRFIAYSILYTLLLVTVLYLVQRFVAPALYLQSIINDQNTVAEEIVQLIEPTLNLPALDRLNQSSLSDITLFNAQGQVVYGSEGTSSLRPIDVVTTFQEGQWNQFVRVQDQTYLDIYYGVESSIIRLRTPFAPIISNIGFLNQFFIIIGIVAIILSIPLSFLFAKSFTDPIIKLNQLALKFKDLALDATLDLKRTDEIGELEHSLKTMAANLKGTLENLEIELQKEKALDQIQKDFVARVSHELKTPLAIIKNSVETLFDAVNDPLPMDLRTMIDEEIDHMVNLSHDLIDLSQLESGRFTIQKNEINLNEFTHHLVKGFNDEEIIIEEEGFLIMSGDPARMRQVLHNLIQNSLHHRVPKTPITITIDAAHHQWSITNAVEGEVALQQLFKPFYKGQEKSPGSGLGLAIVKSILTAHGASIRAHQNAAFLTITIKFPADLTSVS